jgi:hypothetical protein
VRPSLGPLLAALALLALAYAAGYREGRRRNEFDRLAESRSWREVASECVVERRALRAEVDGCRAAERRRAAAERMAGLAAGAPVSRPRP